MKERPILMNGAMVRATLRDADPKTQTRRVVTPQPPDGTREVITFHHPDPRTHYWAFDGCSLMDWSQPCPYGEIGERLYVRETWQHSNHPLGPYDQDCDVFYRADYLDDPLGADLERSADGIRRQWRPSIHMPRTASRITLDITGLRVERLQEISEADAIAEGIYRFSGEGCGFKWQRGEQEYDTAREAFRELWDSLAASGADWNANPWVWVVAFRRIV